MADDSRIEFGGECGRLVAFSVCGGGGGQLLGRAQIDGEAERLAGQTALVEPERQRHAERQLASTDRRVTEVGVTLGGAGAR